MMDWLPIVFVIFKVLVLGTGMFFAVKWHYDQGTKEADKEKERRAVLRGAIKASALFALALLCVGLFAFFLIKKFGL